MREILFRGEHPKAGWVYGAYICHETRQLCPIGSDKLKPDEVKHYIARDGFADWNMPRNIELVPINPETVGQYTGLTDKNGKKIFEGDIFKFKDEVWESSYTSCGTEYDSWPVENYGVVGFNGDTQAPDFVQYKFCENQVEADLHENHAAEFYDFVASLEIAGNIHDNPELLEVEHETD